MEVTRTPGADQEDRRTNLQPNFNHIGVRSFILSGAPLYDFCTILCDFAAAAPRTSPNPHRIAGRVDLTSLYDLKPEIADCGLSGRVRTLVAPDLCVFDNPHWMSCGS